MHTTLPDVRIEQYEGPYDLLVELAKKEQVKLSEISLLSLTESFLAYIKEHQIEPEIMGSFLVVASTLLLIKVRQMMPSQKSEGDEEISDLELRLAEYEKFRASAELLQTRWGNARLLPAHYFAEGDFQEPTQTGTPPFTANQLAENLQNLIGRIPAPLPTKAHFKQRGRSIQEIFELFQKRLELADSILFHETVHGSSRQDQAVSFLAILEMARKQTVRLEQTTPFSTLTIHNI